MTYDARSAPRAQAKIYSAEAAIALGIRAVSIALIAVAVSLNYTHTASFTNSTALAVGAGCLGVLGPFALHAVMHARSFMTGAVVAFVGFVCLAISLASSVASSVTLRGDGTAQRSNIIDARKSYERDRKSMLDELAALGNPRAPSIIQADIASAPVDTAVLRRSQNCADISRDDTKKACQPILTLRKELGAASRKAELEPKIAEAEKALRTLGPVGEADGQSAGLAWALSLAGVNVAEKDVARFVAVIFAVALEIGAAGGLIVAQVIVDAARRHDIKPIEPEQAAQPVIAPVATISQPAAIVAPVAPQHVSLTASDRKVLAEIKNRRQVVGAHRSFAEQINMPQSTVSASIRRLVAAGFVTNADGVIRIQEFSTIRAA